jgi:hypothetical protein
MEHSGALEWVCVRPKARIIPEKALNAAAHGSRWPPAIQESV